MFMIFPLRMVCVSSFVLCFFFQREDKLQSASDIFFGRDGTSVHDDGIFDDGKSQSCAAQFATTPFVHTIEPLENMCQMLVCHTHAVVCETEIEKVLVCSEHPYRYFCSFAGISDGIVGEITENGIDERVVAWHYQFIR